MHNLFANSNRAWEKSLDQLRQQPGWKFFALTVAAAAFVLFFGRSAFSGWPLLLFAADLSLFGLAQWRFRSPVTALAAALVWLACGIWPLPGGDFPWVFIAAGLVWAAIVWFLVPAAVERCGWLASREPEGFTGRWLALTAAIAGVVAAVGFGAAGVLYGIPYPVFGIPVFLLLLTAIAGWRSLLRWQFDLAAWRLVLAFAAFLVLLRVFTGY